MCLLNNFRVFYQIYLGVFSTVVERTSGLQVWMDWQLVNAFPNYYKLPS